MGETRLAVVAQALLRARVTSLDAPISRAVIHDRDGGARSRNQELRLALRETRLEIVVQPSMASMMILAMLLLWTES